MTKILPVLLFGATVPIANWLIGNVGTECIVGGPCLVPVGFGLMAPSGVLMIGLALVLRDWVHETSGWHWAIAAVMAGAALSLVVSPPPIALASATAFLFAELADLLVYARFRAQSRPLAVLLSQLVGAALDSSLFVWIAFGSLDFSAGTTLGKIYAGIAVAALLFWRQKRAT